MDRQPANELITGTIQAWVEVITDGREFDQELDAPRFQKAFRTLAGCSRWPLPKDFLEALPDREQLQIARESRKADPERAAQAVAQIAELFKMP